MQPGHPAQPGRAFPHDRHGIVEQDSDTVGVGREPGEHPLPEREFHPPFRITHPEFDQTGADRRAKAADRRPDDRALPRPGRPRHQHMRAADREPPQVAVLTAAHRQPRQIHRRAVIIPAVSIRIRTVQIDRRDRAGEGVPAGELHPDEPHLPIRTHPAGAGAERMAQGFGLLRPLLGGLPVEQLHPQPVRPPIRADLTNPRERLRERHPLGIRRRHPNRQPGMHHHRPPPPPVDNQQPPPPPHPPDQPAKRPTMGQPPDDSHQDQAGNAQAQPGQAEPVAHHEHGEQQAHRHRMPHKKDQHVGAYLAGQPDKQHPQRDTDRVGPGRNPGNSPVTVNSGHDTYHLFQSTRNQKREETGKAAEAGPGPPVRADGSGPPAGNRAAQRLRRNDYAARSRGNSAASWTANRKRSHSTR